LASHHRPLTFAPEGSRGEVFLNLIFLLSIVMLPVTNGIYGAYRLDSVVAVSYGLHLTIIAGLNALLWILALRGHRNPELLAAAIFPVFACVFATVIAIVAPSVAQFIWCLAFGAPLAGWWAGRRWPLRTISRHHGSRCLGLATSAGVNRRNQHTLAMDALSVSPGAEADFDYMGLRNNTSRVFPFPSTPATFFTVNSSISTG
jgi:hypothetical protein